MYVNKSPSITLGDIKVQLYWESDLTIPTLVSNPYKRYLAGGYIQDYPASFVYLLVSTPILPERYPTVPGSTPVRF